MWDLCCEDSLEVKDNCVIQELNVALVWSKEQPCTDGVSAFPALPRSV